MTREQWIETLTVKQLRGMVADIMTYAANYEDRPLYQRITAEIERRENYQVRT